MIFLRARLAHVLFNLIPSLLPQFCCALCHWEQAEIILRNQKDVEPVESHGKWDIAEDPLKHLGIGKVWGREYPVLCSDNLRERFHFLVLDESWHDLCSSALYIVSYHRA